MKKLWIGWLHRGTKAAKLQGFLEAWGLHPERLELPVDLEGISKRYATAFVVEAELAKAKALSGKLLDGVPITISEAGDYWKNKKKGKHGRVQRTSSIHQTTSDTD